ncbi:hypothetical protein Lal_00014306 [Lupinus albus]|nr:hypothetical protein Lal_00014306 [Lupinus albus]
MVQRQPGLELHLLQGDARLDVRDRGDGEDAFAEEAAVILGGRHDDAQQIVGVAGDREAFQHLRHGGDGGLELVDRILLVALQRDMGEDAFAEPQLARVELHRVAADDADLLHRPHAAPAGGGRQPDRVAQLLHGQAGILLQGRQDPLFMPVELDRRHWHPLSVHPIVASANISGGGIRCEPFHATNPPVPVLLRRWVAGRQARGEDCVRLDRRYGGADGLSRRRSADVRGEPVSPDSVGADPAAGRLYRRAGRPWPAVDHRVGHRGRRAGGAVLVRDRPLGRQPPAEAVGGTPWPLADHRAGGGGRGRRPFPRAWRPGRADRPDDSGGANADLHPGRGVEYATGALPALHHPRHRDLDDIPGKRRLSAGGPLSAGLRLAESGFQHRRRRDRPLVRLPQEKRLAPSGRSGCRHALTGGSDRLREPFHEPDPDHHPRPWRVCRRLLLGPGNRPLAGGRLRGGRGAEPAGFARRRCRPCPARHRPDQGAGGAGRPFLGRGGHHPDRRAGPGEIAGLCRRLRSRCRAVAERHAEALSAVGRPVGRVGGQEPLPDPDAGGHGPQLRPGSAGGGSRPAGRYPGAGRGGLFRQQGQRRRLEDQARLVCRRQSGPHAAAGFPARHRVPHRRPDGRGRKRPRPPPVAPRCGGGGDRRSGPHYLDRRTAPGVVPRRRRRLRVRAL